jgi:hypothetical protein
MRSRLPLGVILLAILLASCGASPGVTVSIGGDVVPMALGSTSEGTACSTSIGDAFPQTLPLTIVRAALPLTLEFQAGQGASEIRGAIYDVDAPAASGGPNEEFTVAGRSGSYEARSVSAGRTYRVLVNVRWSFVVTHGEETHLFEVRVELR